MPNPHADKAAAQGEEVEAEYQGVSYGVWVWNAPTGKWVAFSPVT
jgi:hypothetical protein